MSNTTFQPQSEVAARLHEIAHRDSATKVTVSADDLRQLLLEASSGALATAQRDEAIHQMQQLGQTLGECIVAAGITNPEFALSGPELLMFGEDLKTHLAQSSQGADASNAVISYMLDNRNESPLEFLHCWNEGNFDAIRQEWPNVPEEVFIGADTQHPKTVGFGKNSIAADRPLTVLRLLQECRTTLADGLESVGPNEAPGSVNDRDLVAELDSFLEAHPAVPFGDQQDRAGGGLGVRYDLKTSDAAQQYECAADALFGAIVRDYPLDSNISVKIGRALIDGRVIRHPKNRPGHVTITNIKTGKERMVYHTQVVDQQ